MTNGVDKNKKITIYDIAQELRISIATVSRGAEWKRGHQREDQRGGI